SSGVDEALLPLARVCLAPEPEGRPRDAGEVAGRGSAYLAGGEERLRGGELANGGGQARGGRGRRGPPPTAGRGAGAERGGGAEATAERERQARLLTEIKAARERSTRRLTFALSASVLAIVASAAGGWSWITLERNLRVAETVRAVDEAVEETTLRWGRAKAA